MVYLQNIFEQLYQNYYTYLFDIFYQPLALLALYLQQTPELRAALCAQLLTTPAAQLEREFRSKKFPLPDALMPR